MRVDIHSLPMLVLTCLLLIFSVLSAGCSRDDHPGETVYLKNCSQCHGTAGQGLKNLYPPLDNSPFFTERIAELPCLIAYGSATAAKTGRASSFMPPIPSVPPETMMTLMEFLQNQWAETSSPLTQSLVDQWLVSCVK